MLPKNERADFNRIAKALREQRFTHRPSGSFYSWSDSFEYTPLSTAEHVVHLTLTTYDTIETVCERLRDFAFRTRGVTASTRRELYRLAERVRHSYEMLLINEEPPPEQQ